MPVPSQENDGCPMSVVGNVKTFVAALCFMNIWAISELAKTFFFCLTLGQTGTGVLSYPWALCLSHHFLFVILYITCQIYYFFYTELNARLPIVMIIKQLN